MEKNDFSRFAKTDRKNLRYLHSNRLFLLLLKSFMIDLEVLKSKV